MNAEHDATSQPRSLPPHFGLGIDLTPEYHVANVAHVLPSGFCLPRTGYPFMKLAQLHGVDYTDVLVHAQWIQDGPRSSGEADYQYQCEHRLSARVQLDVYFLSRLPAHERGGPHP